MMYKSLPPRVRDTLSRPYHGGTLAATVRRGVAGGLGRWFTKAPAASGSDNSLLW